MRAGGYWLLVTTGPEPEEARMHDFLSVAQAAKELGITPSGLRTAISEGRLRRTLLHARTSLIAREDVERYKAEHLGRRGKRPRPADALTEQQRKQRAYQQAYYQRRKARKQQPAQPAEGESNV
jgi:excisionase family DNA binding protein